MSTAISHALMVLSFGEMRSEDRPPRDIWLDDEALQDHFERVSEKYGSGRDDDDWIAELDQNELTKGLR